MTIVKRRCLSCLMLLWLVLCPMGSAARAESATLTVTTHHAPITFTVEVARTHAAQAKGLMFRTSLPEDAGMVFLYGEPPRMVHMWMRNTLIPLDMLFIDAHGVIVHLHEQAKPRDESVISSRYNITSVVELNAGMIKKHGISVGDTVSLTP